MTHVIRMMNELIQSVLEQESRIFCYAVYVNTK